MTRLNWDAATRSLERRRARYLRTEAERDDALAALARVEALVEGWFRDSSLFDCSRRETCCADARDDERVDVVEALRAAIAGPTV